MDLSPAGSCVILQAQNYFDNMQTPADIRRRSLLISD